MHFSKTYPKLGGISLATNIFEVILLKHIMWLLQRHFMYFFSDKIFFNELVTCLSPHNELKEIDSNMFNANFYQIFYRYKITFYNKK